MLSYQEFFTICFLLKAVRGGGGWGWGACYVDRPVS